MYVKALEAAGAIVHAYKEFGSYQGDWFALVTYKGKTGWIHGTFGSCSECDAFLAEFDFHSHHCPGRNGSYSSPFDALLDDLSDEEELFFPENCPICQELKQRFILFGEIYLTDILSHEEALALAKNDAEWDLEAEKMIAFLEREIKKLSLPEYHTQSAP